MSPRFGTPGHRSARTAEAYGSISEKETVRHPARSSPISSPPTPEKKLAWVASTSRVWLCGGEGGQRIDAQRIGARLDSVDIPAGLVVRVRMVADRARLVDNLDCLSKQLSQPVRGG